jgi:Type I phosphodiesterase / nucleotide pyrophosphatase
LILGAAPRARALLAALLLAGCAGALPGAPSSSDALAERLGALPEGPPPAARLLFVSIAGLDAEAFAAGPAAGGGSAMPVLARLAELGVTAEHVIPVAPPSAYPVHASLVTGLAPRSHGIPADQRLGERGVRSERYWHASQLRGAALWQLAAERRVPVAALDWPVTVGADLDALLPDVAPTRRGERYADVLAGAATPALAARVRDAGEEGEAAAEPGPVRDRLLVDMACDLARGERPPALLLLRLTETEPALRRAGPRSAEAGAAFSGADAELGRLLACFDAAGLLADAAVAVVGDRGFEPVHTAVRPNVALAEAGLVRTEPEGGVEAWAAYARSNGGSAFVYARDEQRAVEARRVLEETARRTGAFRVVGAAEMSRLGADPEAWFGLDAAPGFAFENPARGALLVASAERGGSGRLQGSPSPAFVLFGRGFRRGVRVPEMRQLDVAPTLAAGLGLEMERAEGRALVGLLAGAGR